MHDCEMRPITSVKTKLFLNEDLMHPLPLEFFYEFVTQIDHHKSNNSNYTSVLSPLVLSALSDPDIAHMHAS